MRKHISYALSLLSRPLPYSSISCDSSRVTLVYFALFTLDVCNALPNALPEGRRESLIVWLYSCAIPGSGGFCGGPLSIVGINVARAWSVPMTYAAIASLIMLGDDCSRIDRITLTNSLASLQRTDGAIDSSPLARGDGDTRFVYAAAATVYLLNLPKCALDAHAALRFIETCRSYEGGFALEPGGESHGGATYCAIAARKLLSKWSVKSGANDDDDVAGFVSDDMNKNDRSTMRWLAFRQNSQDGGLTGRAGKESDACYSFWVGGSISILFEDACHECIDKHALCSWIKTCTGDGGMGFAREPENDADPFHTAYSLAGLALAGEAYLKEVDAVLGLTKDTAEMWDERERGSKVLR